MFLRLKNLAYLVCFGVNVLNAQHSFSIVLPDVQIAADRLVRGDGDTYGLGNWQCSFTATLDGDMLNLNGQISFTENANDFTTILGAYHKRIAVGELEICRACVVTLADNQGLVSGPNIGARGYRWFAGQGLVRRAKIQTDTFGNDVGNIGGTIQFAPIRILVDCSMAKN